MLLVCGINQTTNLYSIDFTMNIHIFCGNIFHLSPTIIRRTLKYFSCFEHYFCIIMYDSKMLYNNVNKDVYDKIFQEYNISNYDYFYTQNEFLSFLFDKIKNHRIFFHSSPTKRTLSILNLRLLLNKRKASNINFICWGENDFITNKSLFQKFNFMLNRKVYPFYRNVLLLSSEDLCKYQRVFRSENSKYVPYVGDFLNLIPARHADREYITIMVSHSGWPHNKHKESFDLLVRFKGKVRIVCPLCYGNEEYINDVISYGQSLFGDNFSYFTDLKSQEEYMAFLSNVDVYISSAELQTGLGAIYRLVSVGAKFFLTGNLYNSLCDSGYSVNPISDLNDITYEDLLQPLSSSDMINNINVYNYINHERAKEQWNNLFL